MLKFADQLKLRGKVELFVSKGAPELKLGELVSGIYSLNGRAPKVYKSCDIDFSKIKLLDKQVIHNIIVAQGKDKVITSLSSGFVNPIARMAIGDRGALPTDLQVPKVATDDMTALFNEVYRDDVDATVLNVGTPTIHEVKFVKTFSATIIPITSFSNQAAPVVNEVGLITADLLGGNPLPRAPVAAPSVPDADEKLFSIRTSKSVPFEAANEIAITVRYTIFID